VVKSPRRAEETWLGGTARHRALRRAASSSSAAVSDLRQPTTALADYARRAIDKLLDQHRQVVTLRDVEGTVKQEGCEMLSISEADLRVLLGRARSRVRSVLELVVLKG
jgi:DNA-directed RNA polymerase specialized sigma24 family protein